MARRKVKELALTSWEDVDAALKEVMECEGRLEAVDRLLTEETTALKKTAAEQAKPDSDRITRLGKDIRAFVNEHKEELDGKTKTLPHGQTGFRKTIKVTIPQGQAEDIIKNLLEYDLEQCVITEVKQTIDRVALHNLPKEKVELVGARWDRKDEFWFEAAKEKAKPDA